MDYGQEQRGPSKLEYFLIFTLIVIIVWAAWIMLEPVVRPVIEQFVQRALESGLDTPTPTPTPTSTPAP
jgi:hypothetical protein